MQEKDMFTTKEAARYLKANNVCVEHGIDGGFLVNFRHRKGISRQYFNNILKSIQLVLKTGIRVNPTMAVHPEEVYSMYENFKFLVSLGLYSMDVHPALLENWKKGHISIFKKQYLRIMKEDKRQNGVLICKDYNLPKGFRFDLVVMPDGNILPNWVYLTLPPAEKQKYYFLKIKEGGVEAKIKILGFFLKAYKDFYKKPGVTYRDFSNFNVEIFLKERPNRIMKRHFENYKRICEITRKIDQKMIEGERRWQI